MFVSEPSGLLHQYPQPNVTNDTQQSKMRLSKTEIKEFEFTSEQLKEIRHENRITSQQDSVTLISQSDQQEQNADILFKELFVNRKVH